MAGWGEIPQNHVTYQNPVILWAGNSVEVPYYCVYSCVVYFLQLLMLLIVWFSPHLLYMKCSIIKAFNGVLCHIINKYSLWFWTLKKTWNTCEKCMNKINKLWWQTPLLYFPWDGASPFNFPLWQWHCHMQTDSDQERD